MRFGHDEAPGCVFSVGRAKPPLADAVITLTRLHVFAVHIHFLNTWGGRIKILLIVYRV